MLPSALAAAATVAFTWLCAHPTFGNRVPLPDFGRGSHNPNCPKTRSRLRAGSSSSLSWGKLPWVSRFHSFLQTPNQNDNFHVSNRNRWTKARRLRDALAGGRCSCAGAASSLRGLPSKPRWFDPFRSAFKGKPKGKPGMSLRFFETHPNRQKPMTTPMYRGFPLFGRKWPSNQVGTILGTD